MIYKNKLIILKKHPIETYICEILGKDITPSSILFGSLFNNVILVTSNEKDITSVTIP